MSGNQTSRFIDYNPIKLKATLVHFNTSKRIPICFKLFASNPKKLYFRFL